MASDFEKFLLGKGEYKQKVVSDYQKNLENDGWLHLESMDAYNPYEGIDMPEERGMNLSEGISMDELESLQEMYGAIREKFYNKDGKAKSFREILEEKRESLKEEFPGCKVRFARMNGEKNGSLDERMVDVYVKKS